MGDKVRIPVHFSVTVEEVLYRPADERWTAQFKVYPHGYFRGTGRTPALAMSRAWRIFDRKFNYRERWWAPVFSSV